jgi:hypothetical protein
MNIIPHVKCLAPKGKHSKLQFIRLEEKVNEIDAKMDDFLAMQRIFSF